MANIEICNILTKRAIRSKNSKYKIVPCCNQHIKDENCWSQQKFSKPQPCARVISDE